MLSNAECLDPGVRCFADPCETSSCPAHPDAVCVAKYCTFTFRDVLYPAGCTALYVDLDSGDVLDDCEAGSDE
eukprot:365711-Chlamydomonas_euryale.AAC.2